MLILSPTKQQINNYMPIKIAPRVSKYNKEAAETLRNTETEWPHRKA